MRAKTVLLKIIGKKAAEEKKTERIQFLKDLLWMEVQRIAKKPGEYACNVAKDFYVDSLIISKKDGSVLMSSDGDGFDRAVKGSSLYEYIASEMPGTKSLTIKDKNGYNIIYPVGDLVCLLRSSGEISDLEVKRIAERLNEGMQKFNLK
jgi:hypothetical protein